MDGLPQPIQEAFQATSVDAAWAAADKVRVINSAMRGINVYLVMIARNLFFRVSVVEREGKSRITVEQGYGKGRNENE